MKVDGVMLKEDRFFFYGKEYYLVRETTNEESKIIDTMSATRRYLSESESSYACGELFAYARVLQILGLISFDDFMEISENLDEIIKRGVDKWNL